MTRHVLSERLKRLVEHDILVKTPYVDRQERFEYRLTEKGMELYPVLLSMANWADKWMDDGAGAPMLYHHKNCGKIFKPILTCSECGEEIQAKQVLAKPSPLYVDYLRQAQKKKA